MSIEKNIEQIHKNIKKMKAEREESQELMQQALETIKTLQEAVPNVLCDTGATICKLAESVLPGENVVVIKLNPSTNQCTVHILCEKEKGISIEDFEYFLANAHAVGKHMENSDGMLASRHDKTLN